MLRGDMVGGTQRMGLRIAVLASLVLAALGLAVAALVWLGKLDMPGALDTGPRTTTEHTIDHATGETRITIPQKDGIATLRSGPNVPVTLPEGFSLFPGSRVVGNSLVARTDDGQNTLVTFDTDAAAADVIAHYRKQAKAAGFAIALELTTGDTTILVAERKGDGARLSATATQGSPATGQLIVGGVKAG